MHIWCSPSPMNDMDHHEPLSTPNMPDTTLPMLQDMWVVVRNECMLPQLCFPNRPSLDHTRSQIKKYKYVFLLLMYNLDRILELSEPKNSNHCSGYPELGPCIGRCCCQFISSWKWALQTAAMHFRIQWGPDEMTRASALLYLFVYFNWHVFFLVWITQSYF